MVAPLRKNVLLRPVQNIVLGQGGCDAYVTSRLKR